MRKNNGRKGFTLIELMIVIAIIIILAAIAIPNYLRMTDRAKKSAIESDLKSLATALETFKTDWGEYPGDGWDTMKAELTAGTEATKNVTTATNLLGEDGGIVYITPAAITAIENKADKDTDGPLCTYATDSDVGYKVDITATIGGETNVFECTAGGTIELNPATTP